MKSISDNYKMLAMWFWGMLTTVFSVITHHWAMHVHVEHHVPGYQATEMFMVFFGCMAVCIPIGCVMITVLYYWSEVVKLLKHRNAKWFYIALSGIAGYVLWEPLWQLYFNHQWAVIAALALFIIGRQFRYVPKSKGEQDD